MSNKPYFSTYVQDLEQDPFDATDFVERLAWRITNGKEDFKVDFLKKKFEEEIESLQLSSDNFQSKLRHLEDQQNRAKARYSESLQHIQQRNADVLDRVKHLDGTMQTISAKVVHLGDQLESVHAPRARAFDALQLMRHFDEFMADQPLSSPIFTDPDRLLEAAEMIQKLASISQELVRDRFHLVQQRIARKYDEIEELLCRDFERTLDRKRLRDIAAILAEFKCFSRCIDAFIERAQQGAFHSDNVFLDIQHVCEKTKPLIDEIFPDPTQVMCKLILNLFHGKLQETLASKLEETRDELDDYLKTMAEFYAKTEKLGQSLQKYQSASDPHFVDTLIQSLFAPYLKVYPEIEERFINQRCKEILKEYYDAKGHQKRNVSAGGLGEFKRDLQARLLTVENFGGETFLSEEVAINILQEIKSAITRCNMMCKRQQSLDMVQSIFNLLLKYLYNEHVDYAIELALAGISLAEPKTEPPTNFFAVVRQTAAITHLFVKQYEDLFAPLVGGSAVETQCASKRDSTLQNLESRINLGLDRQINALVGYVRFILANEQKRTDFKPDDENRALEVMSRACSLVVRYLKRMHARVSDSVDGGNLHASLTEFGHRLYQAILAHVRTFNYNLTGAMLLLCDVDEYKKCVSEWGIAEVRRQFEVLHALANLLVVRPANLPEAVTATILTDIDRQVIFNFVRQREDGRECQLYLSTL